MLSDALEINKDDIATNVQNDNLMDLTIHLDDGSHVKLHSVVLAAASRFFQMLGEVGYNSAGVSLYISHLQHCLS